MNLEIEQRLLAKIRRLPANRILQVEDFIDFLNDRDLKSDQDLIHSAAKLAEPSFAKVWDNAEDAAYDNL